MADADVTPKSKLAELTQALEKRQQDNTQIVAEIDEIKSRIADLTKITAETDQKIAAYDKARSGVDEQRKKSENFFAAKKKLLEDTLPNEQEIIEKKKNSDKAIGDLKDELQRLNQQVDEKQNAVNAAQKTLDNKKTEYTTQLDRMGTATQALSDLRELEKQATQEGDKNNFARMYFFVLEMEDTLKAAELPATEEYRKLLDRLGTDLVQASVDFRKAKADLDSAIAERKTKQKELEQAAAGRRAQTAASIPEGTPSNI